MSERPMERKLRNVAIVAHVDHGKTTLIDQFLRQTGAFRANQAMAERVMDSNPIERERGITIFSKSAAIRHKGVKINIVDTPGHADFGAEVERILDMVDGVLLLVDASEGVMPQTRFVLSKSLQKGLMPVVIINKVDRPDRRIKEVEDEVAGLFLALEADDRQLGFPTVYASSKIGSAALTPEGVLECVENSGAGATILPILDEILRVVPPPGDDTDGPAAFLVSSLDYSDFLGRIGIGRLRRGTLKKGQALVRLGKDIEERGRIRELYTFEALTKVETAEVEAGDIAAVAGFEDLFVGETLADPADPTRLPAVEVDEPTLGITMLVNGGPLAGRSGKFLTSRHLRERISKELKTNVALRVEEGGGPDEIKLLGRGELHLGILFETMRREGFEFCLSRPRVVVKHTPRGPEEPLEDLFLEMDQAYQGAVMEAMGRRRAELQDLVPTADGRARMTFLIPMRGLLGFRGEYLAMTRGTGVLYHSFAGFGAHRGDLPGRQRGVMVAKEAGESTAYALEGLQERGTLMIPPGVQVYQGMIVGLNSRGDDMVVQACRKKHLTNMRSAGAEELNRLAPPMDLTLEQMVEFIQDDELVEVTPDMLRLRKRELDPTQRKREALGM